jgi:hypothetical protein
MGAEFFQFVFLFIESCSVGLGFLQSFQFCCRSIITDAGFRFVIFWFVIFRQAGWGQAGESAGAESGSAALRPGRRRLAGRRAWSKFE